ncbi:TIGR03759 family integrating conjugative element protein [Pseudomonas sp. GD03721]|nr:MULTISPECIES: TIGR03759 family integrating conjugative element protein [unclassified Pseudomonas]MDH1440373.1 TIGR03759 family integrating conjugative element protein [Pseudomonas sp. GD03722]WGG03538.1 TIGR03759 family integrating conjugative element protein [Pseudomonas sp. GD03721]WGG07706.1 TIGR03759 family integrating conjugative element protein [Pseudomonas sp. GD03919]
MNCSLPTVTACLTALVAAASLAGDTNTAQSQVRSSEPTPLEHRQSGRASDWGLTEQEWSRFEEIQTGPRGFWSPHLDPLTTLGVEARNEQERRRYAELQVKLEAQRAERELAYQRAYDAAWARLFPGLLPVQGLGGSPSSPTSRRLALFVEVQCPACTAEAQRLQQQDTEFDLYLVGSQGEDARIRTWARQAGIDPARVQRRQITLNHDRGQWLGLGAHGPLPALFQQVHGQWQRLEQ